MKQINFRLTETEHADLTALAASVKMTAPAYAAAVIREELEQARIGGSVYAETLLCEEPRCPELKQGRSDYCLPHAVMPRCAESWCRVPVKALGDTCNRDHTAEEDDL